MPCSDSTKYFGGHKIKKKKAQYSSNTLNRVYKLMSRSWVGCTTRNV